MIHAYTRKRGPEIICMKKRAKKGKKKQQKKKRRKERRKENRIKKTSYIRAGRRPSPEGTRLLFSGTISPTICLGDGPTEKRHNKTRHKARKTIKMKKKGERSDTELEKRSKYFYVQLVG